MSLRCRVQFTSLSFWDNFLHSWDEEWLGFALMLIRWLLWNFTCCTNLHKNNTFAVYKRLSTASVCICLSNDRMRMLPLNCCLYSKYDVWFNFLLNEHSNSYHLFAPRWPKLKKRIEPLLFYATWSTFDCSGLNTCKMYVEIQFFVSAVTMNYTAVDGLQ